MRQQGCPKVSNGPNAVLNPTLQDRPPHFPLTTLHKPTPKDTLLLRLSVALLPLKFGRSVPGSQAQVSQPEVNLTL